MLIQHGIYRHRHGISDITQKRPIGSLLYRSLSFRAFILFIRVVVPYSLHMAQVVESEFLPFDQFFSNLFFRMVFIKKSFKSGFLIFPTLSGTEIQFCDFSNPYRDFQVPKKAPLRSAHTRTLHLPKYPPRAYSAEGCHESHFLPTFHDLFM